MTVKFWGVEDAAQVERVADALAEHCHETRGVLLMMARAAIAAMHPTPQEPRCAKCGHPKSNHPYRHPFVSIAQDAAMDRLVAEGQRCDAMTPQEAAKVLWDMLQLSDGVPKIDQDAAQALWDRVQHAGGFYPVKEFLAELAGIDTGEDSHE